MRACFHLTIVLGLIACGAPPKSGSVRSQSVCPSNQISCASQCADLQSDPHNCGACGLVCSSDEVCQRGLCVDCDGDGDEVLCNGACVSLAADPANCGGCGVTCSAGSSCSSGQCVCTEPLVSCGGQCVDTTTSAQNCGACGNACGLGQACVASKCVARHCGTSFDKQSYPGQFATAVVSADFDGDGHIDIVANGGLYLNRGDGTFALPTTIAGLGRRVAAADVDGDGRPDLVSTDIGLALVSRNLGGGTFAAPTTYDARDRIGEDSSALTVADVSGDGRPDIVLVLSAGSAFPGSMATLINDGAGNFGPAVRTPIGSDVYQLDSADFNRDGLADIVAINSLTEVDILLSNGDGTFAATVPLRTKPAFSVATGDFNGDGQADLAVLQNNGAFRTASMLVYLGNGDGTFQSSTERPYSTKVGELDGALAATAVDLTGSGTLDIVARTKFSVVVLRGKGNGTFPTEVDIPASWFDIDQTEALPMPMRLQTGDFNGDGANDIVIPDTTFDVYLNHCR